MKKTKRITTLAFVWTFALTPCFINGEILANEPESVELDSETEINNEENTSTQAETDELTNLESYNDVATLEPANEIEVENETVSFETEEIKTEIPETLAESKVVMK